jgi:hypothetical protein
MNTNCQTDVENDPLPELEVNELAACLPAAPDPPVSEAARKQLEINRRLEELERQIERASIFGSSALGEGFLRLGEIGAFGKTSRRWSLTMNGSRRIFRLGESPVFFAR